MINIAFDTIFVKCIKEMPSLTQLFFNLLYELLHNENCFKLEISSEQLTKIDTYAIFHINNTLLRKRIFAS